MRAMKRVMLCISIAALAVGCVDGDSGLGGSEWALDEGETPPPREEPQGDPGGGDEPVYDCFGEVKQICLAESLAPEDCRALLERRCDVGGVPGDVDPGFDCPAMVREVCVAESLSAEECAVLVQGKCEPVAGDPGSGEDPVLACETQVKEICIAEGLGAAECQALLAQRCSP